MIGRGNAQVAGHPCERPGTRSKRFGRYSRGRVSTGPPGPGRNPAPSPVADRGYRGAGGLSTWRGVPAATDQPDHAAAILRAGRASGGEKSRSPCTGILSRRLPSPDYACRVGGLAGAQPNISAGEVNIHRDGVYGPLFKVRSFLMCSRSGDSDSASAASISDSV